jgi:hypothetical protein
MDFDDLDVFTNPLDIQGQVTWSRIDAVVFIFVAVG